jgi:hypothetical protein
MKDSSWRAVKTRGSNHYKKDPTKVEPIDLYRDGGMLRDFCLSNIIKYAYRNRADTGKPLLMQDLEKIKHYADILIADQGGEVT